MDYLFEGKNYSVSIRVTDSCAFTESGHFGGIRLLHSPLTSLLLRKLDDGAESRVTEFGSVRSERNGGSLRIYLSPAETDKITVALNADADDDGISWEVGVVNDSEEYSVMEAAYPTPIVTAKQFSVFEPGCCGKVIKHAETAEYANIGDYPKHQICMQYFAAYGETDGVYLGIEDGSGSIKRLGVKVAGGSARFAADCYAPGMTLPRDSFGLPGRARWQYISGDWYDASMIYADFVKKRAVWLPTIGKHGREDTPEKFRDLPLWIVGYIPNTPSQGDNRPMSLAIGMDGRPEDFWYQSVIDLKEELDVPVAFHVYNWHEIPFNVEYPHFLPAKESFRKGLAELKKHGVSVFPYINAVSWETLDGEMGHEVNFENTGIHGAVIDQHGRLITAKYPQITVKGTQTALAPICPTFSKWHEIIADLSERMMTEYDIDGIYFDQISAHNAQCCCNPEHSHLPGGGSYWADDYRLMMKKVRAKMPAGSFAFSECNAETYMSAFDGQLTWTWVQNDEVPAFPAVYAGYTQMIGRFNLKNKLHDFAYFKYTCARSLIYGQQPGWITTIALEQPEWREYLKGIVRERYRLSELFCSAYMLRPPRVTSDIPDVVTSPAGLWLEKEDIVMEQVFGGAWRYRDGHGTVIMLANVSESEANYEMSFDLGEYGIAGLPDGFEKSGGRAVTRGKLAPREIRIWETK